MLEILVAIVIFSFGVLGLVGLQAAAIKNASGAQYRIEAGLLAASLVAQIRTADPAAVTTLYASPSGLSYLAWKSRVSDTATGLPGSAVAANAPTVEFPAATPGVVNITIYWQPPGESSFFSRHKYEITANYVN